VIVLCGRIRLYLPRLAKRTSIVLAILAIATWPELATRIPELSNRALSGDAIPFAIFSALWLFAVIAISVMSLHAPRAIVWAYAVAFFVSSIVVVSYDITMHEVMEVTQFERMLVEIRFADDALLQYPVSALIAVLSALPILCIPLLTSVNFLQHRDRMRLFPLIGVCSVFLPIAVIARVCWMRGGEGTVALPTALRPASYLVAIEVEKMRTPKVTSANQFRVIDNASKSEIEDIVLVVDESIARVATFLSTWTSDYLGQVQLISARPCRAPTVVPTQTCSCASAFVLTMRSTILLVGGTYGITLTPLAIRLYL
jgi:hypothetical protein